MTAPKDTPSLTAAPDTARLVERLRLKRPTYAQQAADAITALQARLAELEADAAKPVKNEPGTFHMSTLFDAIEWRSKTYVPISLYRDVIDRLSVSNEAQRALQAQVTEAHQALAQIRDLTTEHGGAAKALQIINSILPSK